MITLAEFIALHDQTPLDFDGYFGDQCMDLVQYYHRDVVGASPPLRGNAIDVWRLYPFNIYTRIANAPNNYPQPGDIVIWGGPNASVGTGPFGHIAVCSRPATATAFMAFSQNWPTGSNCHEVTFGYGAVLGWLRRIVPPPPPPTPPAPPAPPPAPLPPSHHAPIDAADAVDTLRRHALDLSEHPSISGTNALIAAVKVWPAYRS